MSDQDSHLPDQINTRVAVRVREEIAKRRISRQLLADEARISLSTLEKALSGHRPFTLATIIRLEQAMGVALREQAGEAPVQLTRNGNSHAAEELGAYSRASVSWLEGDYLTLRPSFGEDKALFAYITEIGWDFDAGHLNFVSGNVPTFRSRNRERFPFRIFRGTSIWSRIRPANIAWPSSLAPASRVKCLVS